MLSPEECPHDNFDAQVDVGKLTDINTLMVDLKIVCRECGSRFSFIGLPSGIDFKSPTCSVSGLEARLPAKLVGPKDFDTEVGQYKLEF